MSGRPEISGIYWVQSFSVAYGPINVQIYRLINDSSLWQHFIAQREDEVMVYRLTGLVPPQNWSTGEKLLYGLILSLAGRAEVNLSTVAAYFKHTELREPILAALNAAFEQH